MTHSKEPYKQFWDSKEPYAHSKVCIGLFTEYRTLLNV
jgi:hypothetical protein